MNILDWKIEEVEFLKDNVEQNGSRFLIGNGFMGYRGTLEEFGKEELVSLNMAGLFDQNGELWRESVNAPNPFYVKTSVGGVELNAKKSEIKEHNQSLNICCGLHTRKTVFKVEDTLITVSAERFLSMKNENLAVLKYSVSSDKNVEISVNTYLDYDVWNINGDHFEVLSNNKDNGITSLCIKTLENKIPMNVYECIIGADNENTINLKAGEEYSFVKLCGVYWGSGVENSKAEFINACSKDYVTILD